MVALNKKIIGLTLIVVSLLSMGIWEFWGRETVSYETIIVLKKPLEANVVLMNEDFIEKKVDSPSQNALKPKDLNWLVGMETVQYVAEGIELRKEYFGQSEYKVGEDTSKGIISLSTDWLLSFPQTLSRGDQISLYSNKIKVGECIVAHVRDSSNNEVIFSQRDRENANGTILYIEVIADVSTLLDITSAAAEGNKFALVNLR